MSRRVLLGTHGYGSGSGLRVAQPGRDAGSSNPADLTFDSDWPAVLPLLQQGTFSLGGNSSATINFPDPGYVPFCFFLINGGDETGQAYVPVIPLHQWCAYQNVSYASEGSASFLKLNAGRGVINAQYQLYLPNGNSQGWPGSFQVAYAVYRLPAA